VAFAVRQKRMERSASSRKPAIHDDRRDAPLVMIADDAEDARDIYETYLKFRGYRVVTAADGADALVRAIECHPDIILMDLLMPRMDGWEAIGHLKGDPRTASIPVVALSAHVHDAARAAARAAGADACLTKPCLPPQLLMMVRALLTWRGAALPAPQPALQALPLPNRNTNLSQQKMKF
jgi:two-component system cell cycle response regulator DivK